MNDNERFRQMKIEADKERQLKLAIAKESARIHGKQPFDLDAMYALWPDCPDFRYESVGVHYPRERRIRDWEEIYYCSYPKIMSLEPFVHHMKEMQGHGAFD